MPVLIKCVASTISGRMIFQQANLGLSAREKKTKDCRYLILFYEETTQFTDNALSKT